MRFTEKLSARRRAKSLLLMRKLVSIRIGYGKATIFNRVFESSKTARIEQIFAKIGLFGASRFRVNHVALTIVAAPVAHSRR